MECIEEAVDIVKGLVEEQRARHFKRGGMKF